MYAPNDLWLLFSKVSAPRQSLTAATAKSSSAVAGKVDGHHLKQLLQSTERKVKQPRQLENRHSRTGSKKIPLHRSKPRSKKGLVQLLNKPKEESKESSKDVHQNKAKRLSSVVTPTTCTSTTNSTSATSSHLTTTDTAVANTCNMTTDNKPTISSSTKSTAVNGSTSEVQSFQGQPTVSVSSIPQPLYYPNGSHLVHHQQLPYYMPAAYQPHPPVNLQYPHPYHPYRYSSVPVYVADVTRRYNEMYGGVNGVYGGQQYRQHFTGVPQVCNASTQMSSDLPSSSGGDGIGSKVHHTDGVKAGSKSMLIAQGKTNGIEEEVEDVVTGAKQLMVVQGLLNMLKKKLEGTYVGM